MSFTLRSFANNIGTQVNSLWNSQKRKDIQNGIGASINTGAKQLAKTATNTYNSSKPVVEGAVKSMASTVGKAVNQYAPIVTQNFKSTASLAGQGLRGMVNNYVQKQAVQNKMLDPRANKQITIDREKYGLPQKTIIKTKISNNSYKPTVTPIVKTPVQTAVTPTTQPVGIGTTIAQFTNQPAGQKYYDTIVNTSKGLGINPAFSAAGLMNESGLDEKTPDSINYDSKGKEVSRDRGIAQINDKAHPEVTEAQARDPNFAIPWKINKIAENLKKYPDINQAIAAYNLGDAGVANSTGPYASGLGKYGQNYINKFAKNLTPELIQQLGIKISSPEEEKLINTLIAKERENKKKKIGIKK